MTVETLVMRVVDIVNTRKHKAISVIGVAPANIQNKMTVQAQAILRNAVYQFQR